MTEQTGKYGSLEQAIYQKRLWVTIKPKQPLKLLGNTHNDYKTLSLRELDGIPYGINAFRKKFRFDYRVLETNQLIFCEYYETELREIIEALTVEEVQKQQSSLLKVVLNDMLEQVLAAQERFIQSFGDE